MRTPRGFFRRARRLIILSLATVLLVAISSPAAAELVRDAPPGDSSPDDTITITDTGNGQAVDGFIDPDYDPLSGYPSPGDPPSGDPHDVAFAGIIIAESDSGNLTELYCIDILTETRIGLSYELGTWDESAVPNVGYVARILNDYFPTTSEPVSAPTDNARAAAVQAAIWFFTDNFLVAPGHPLFTFTSQIVTEVLAAGPMPEPEAPTLEITGPSSGEPGELIGPFTLNTSAAEAVLDADGATMYTDEVGRDRAPQRLHRAGRHYVLHSIRRTIRSGASCHCRTQRSQRQRVPVPARRPGQSRSCRRTETDPGSTANRVRHGGDHRDHRRDTDAKPDRRTYRFPRGQR